MIIKSNQIILILSLILISHVTSCAVGECDDGSGGCTTLSSWNSAIKIDSGSPTGNELCSSSFDASSGCGVGYCKSITNTYYCLKITMDGSFNVTVDKAASSSGAALSADETCSSHISNCSSTQCKSSGNGSSTYDVCYGLSNDGSFNVAYQTTNNESVTLNGTQACIINSNKCSSNMCKISGDSTTYDRCVPISMDGSFNPSANIATISETLDGSQTCASYNSGNCSSNYCKISGNSSSTYDSCVLVSKNGSFAPSVSVSSYSAVIDGTQTCINNSGNCNSNQCKRSGDSSSTYDLCVDLSNGTFEVTTLIDSANFSPSLNGTQICLTGNNNKCSNNYCKFNLSSHDICLKISLDGYTVPAIVNSYTEVLNGTQLCFDNTSTTNKCGNNTCKHDSSNASAYDICVNLSKNGSFSSTVQVATYSASLDGSQECYDYTTNADCGDNYCKKAGDNSTKYDTCVSISTDSSFSAAVAVTGTSVTLDGTQSCFNIAENGGNCSNNYCKLNSTKDYCILISTGGSFEYTVAVQSNDSLNGSQSCYVFSSNSNDCDSTHCKYPGVASSGTFDRCVEKVFDSSNGTYLFSNSSNMCVTACSSNECVDSSSTKTCIAIVDGKCGGVNQICTAQSSTSGSYQIRASESDVTCVSSCANSECIDTSGTNYFCTNQSLVSTVKVRESTSSLICTSTCSASECIDQFAISYACISPSSSRFTETGNALCVVECSDTSYCPNSSTFNCQAPQAGQIYESNESICVTSCTNTDQCFNDSFVCQHADSTHISAGDGTACLLSCEVGECLNVMTFVCQAPEIGYFKEENNYYCVSECSEKDHCPNPSTFVCQLPTSSLYFEGNNTVCVSACSNIYQCPNNTTFICQLPEDGQVFDTNSSLCLSGVSCTDNSKCVDAFFYCATVANGISKNATTGYCKCDDTSKCISRDINKCVKPYYHNVADGEGNICSLKCPDTSKCYDSTTFVCQTPSAGKIADLDGSSCKSVCSDKTKCYDNTFSCVDGASDKIIRGDGSVCQTSCASADQCYDTTTYLCQTYGKGIYKYNNQCVSTCPDGTCYHSYMSECITIDSTFTGNLSDCKCVDTNNCVSRTAASCIAPDSSNISDGDGSYCKYKCTSSDNCWNPYSHKCTAKEVSGVVKYSSKSSGSSCTCAENKLSTCLNNDAEYSCIAGSSGKLINKDGGMCTATCNDTSKCFDTDFICRNPDSTHISDADGSSCKASCSDTSKCYDYYNFNCISPSKNKYIKVGGGVCNKTCGSGYCFHSKLFKCLSLGSEFTTLNGIEGGQCVCVDNKKCYKEDTETCIDTSDNLANPDNLISNNDGLYCSSTGKCSSNSKCYHPTKLVCYDKSSNNLNSDTNGSCKCLPADVNTKCIDPDNIVPTCITSSSSSTLLPGDGTLCLSVCPLTKCYGSDFLCKPGQDGEVANGDGSACTASCSDTSMCLNPVSYLCMTTASNNFSSVSDGSSCSCSNTSSCVDISTGECVTAISGKVRDNDAAAQPLCKSNNLCSDSVNYCVHPGTFTCIQASNYGLIISDGQCYCSDASSQCLPKNNNTCVAGSASNILDGYGGLCLSECSNINQCYHPSTGICLETDTFGFENTGAGNKCICEDKNKCLSTTENECVSGASGRIIDGDGGICKTSCSDTSKCYDSSTYICQDAEEGKVSNNNGGVCSTLCTNTNQCYHPRTFICDTPLSANYLSDTPAGSVCTCTDITRCVNPYDYNCIAGKSKRINNEDKGICTESCNDKTKCYTTSTGTPYTCALALSGSISLNDGGICSTSCDSGKCFNASTFICQLPDGTNKLETDKEACVTSCAAGKCIDPSLLNLCITYDNTSVLKNGSTNLCECSDNTKCYFDKECISPESGKLNNQDKGPCITECPSNKCLHPTMFTCLTPSATLGKDQDGYCKCIGTDAAKCLNTTDSTCIVASTTIANDGNGSVCKATGCSDKTKCYNTSNNNICQSPSLSNLAISAGGACSNSSSCPTTTNCYHPGTFICQTTSNNNMVSVSDGGRCVCSSNYNCIDAASTSCIKAKSGKLNNLDGSLCSSSCSDSDKCFNNEFICIYPNYNNLKNDDNGSQCSELCADDSKCFSPITFSCIPFGINFQVNKLGIECSCKTGFCYTNNDTCEDESTATCLDKYVYQKIWFINHVNFVEDNITYLVQKIGSIISDNEITYASNIADLGDNYIYLLYRKAISTQTYNVDDPKYHSSISSTYDYSIFLPNIQGYKVGKFFVAFKFEYDCTNKIVYYHIKYFNTYNRALVFYNNLGDYSYDKVLSNSSTILDSNGKASLTKAKKVSATIKSDDALKAIFLNGKLDPTTTTNCS